MYVNNTFILKPTDTVEINVMICHDETQAVIRIGENYTMMIKPEALRSYIDKLEAVEAEITGKAKEHIEQIRLQRHVSVLSEESIRRLRQNGTAL